MSMIIICIVVAAVSYVLAAIYKRRWNKDLTVQIAFEQERCYEGDTIVIREVVRNKKRLPLPSLVIKFPIDRSIEYQEKENTNVTDKQYRTDCILARAYEQVTRTFPVTCRKRGYYSISNIDLVAADFFYQSVFAEKRTNQSNLYVYPSRTKVREVPYAVNKLMGEHVTKRFLYEDPFAFKGIREYAPKDSMRRINWKASAKTGELMVNQYYDTSKPSLKLFLDVETEGMRYEEKLQEELIRVARYYVESCRKRGIPVELITNGSDIRTKEELCMRDGVEKVRVEEYLKMLARIDVRNVTRPFCKLLKQETRKRDEVSVLLSVSQEKSLQLAYEEYLGKEGVGQWFLCIGRERQKRAVSRRIQIIYGEVE